MKKIKNENIEMKGAEMEEIEVNEYVRTENGYIIKIDKNATIFNLGYEEQYIDMETTEYGFTLEEKIVKHSKQLIDLIEVGDIVNQEEVIEVRKQDGKIYLMTGYVPQSYIKDGIKTILTKEIYMANCYKVGGE